MNLQQFEKIAYENELGLVGMKIVEPFAPYRKDAIAGFPPDEAFRLFQRKMALPVDAKGKPVKAAVDDKDESGIAGADTSTSVEIPENWEQMHHLQRLKLAKDLTGRQDVESAKIADEIIRAEFEKRAGSAS